jgi:hypothetical protein
MRSTIPTALAMLGTVSGLVALTIFAGDNPMPSSIVQRTANQAVGMLASDTLEEPERGKQLILQERTELISQLSAIISDSQNHVRRPDAVEKAMSLLGEFRAPEASKVLVTYIGFPCVKHPEAGEYPRASGSRELRSAVGAIERLLPAVPALMKIGEPCIDEVIKKLSTADHVLEIKACQTVLKNLNEPPSVRAKLERAIEGAAPRKREQLKKTLEMLDLPAAPKTK